MYYCPNPDRSYLTAEALLADADERRSCQAVVARGGKYYEGPAQRPTIVEAIAKLKLRGDRRSCRGIAEAALRGVPGHVLAEAKRRREKREVEAKRRWRNRVADGKLGLSTVRKTFRRDDVQKAILGEVGSLADGAIRLIACAVGPLGEQAERDLREIQTDTDFSGKQGRHHWYEETTLHRVEILPDWSAALVTLRTYKSWGRAGFSGYEKQGGVSFRTWLIVRDVTSGEAHVLRVPPRFGNASTQFFQSFEYSDAGVRYFGRKLADAYKRRIHAAVAYTFGLKPHEYHPQVQA